MPSNLTAVRKTLKALRTDGKLNDAKAGEAQLALTLAADLDDPDRRSAATAKVLADLLRSLTAETTDDTSTHLIATIRAVPAAPRDSRAS